MTKHSTANGKRPEDLQIVRRPLITAIMVDGGFYRRRAHFLFGDKEPQDRADELMAYCRRHIRESRSNLYRVFYYDCPPSDKVLYHPLLKKQVNLRKSDQYRWANDFFTALIRKRKVAFRRGEELETQRGYFLKPAPLKDLCAGRKTVDDLTEQDFGFDIAQKGVDMRMGLDIASLAQAGIVNQIIMISGDSDFVPAAKYARRGGIDFLLDPMWAHVTDSLSEHVDGVRECVNRPPENEKDPLHITQMSNIDSGSTLIDDNLEQ